MDDVVGRVGPVHGGRIGRPRQPVGDDRVVGLEFDQGLAAGLAQVDGIQLGLACVTRLVHGAGPEAPHRIGLAVVETGGGDVVAETGNRAERATPVCAPGRCRHAGRLPGRRCASARYSPAPSAWPSFPLRRNQDSTAGSAAQECPPNRACALPDARTATRPTDRAARPRRTMMSIFIWLLALSSFSCIDCALVRPTALPQSKPVT